MIVSSNIDLNRTLPETAQAIHQTSRDIAWTNISKYISAM